MAPRVWCVSGGFAALCSSGNFHRDWRDSALRAAEKSGSKHTEPDGVGHGLRENVRGVRLRVHLDEAREVNKGRSMSKLGLQHCPYVSLT